MAENRDLGHFIPVACENLRLWLSSKAATPSLGKELTQVFELMAATIHFEYHRLLNELKSCYCPTDPDSDVQPLGPVRATDHAGFFKSFRELLERCNFERLDTDAILAAADKESTRRGLHMRVNPEVFEHLEGYVRGDGTVNVTHTSWWNPWGKSVEKVPVHQRMVLAFRLRPHKSLPQNMDLGAIHLKLFRRVPKADVEMLLPGAAVKLSTFDKGMIGLPIISGLMMLVLNLVLGIMFAGVAAVAKLVSWGMALAFGGYGYRSYQNLQVKRQEHNLALTQNLYYQKLDSNAGVIMRLVDEAEEQECREAYLAYFALVTAAPPEGWTREMLDDWVELFLEGEARLQVDFEVEDALAKLERFGVLTRTGDRLRALPPQQALVKLDAAWDNFFNYSNAAPQSGSARG